MCSRVDLPEPEAPVSATNAPASMDWVTLSAAVPAPSPQAGAGPRAEAMLAPYIVTMQG